MFNVTSFLPSLSSLSSLSSLPFSLSSFTPSPPFPSFLPFPFPSHSHSLPPLISLQTCLWLGSSLQLPTLKLAALLSSTAQYLVPLAPPYGGTTTQPSSQTLTSWGYRYLPPASSQFPMQLSTILGSTHATLAPAMHTVLLMWLSLLEVSYLQPVYDPKQDFPSLTSQTLT